MNNNSNNLSKGAKPSVEQRVAEVLRQSSWTCAKLSVIGSVGAVLFGWLADRKNKKKNLRKN